MTLPRPAAILGRVCFSLFVLLTSVYCLLAYIPFTYEQVHVAGLLPWLTTFVKIHPYIYWVLLAGVIPTVIPDLRRRETKILAFGFLLFTVVAGVLMIWRPLLSGLRNDVRSFEWALVSLLPLACLAAMDWLGEGGQLRWEPSESVEDARVFQAAWQSAVFSAVVYACIFYLRHRNPGEPSFARGEGFAGQIWSVFSHLLLFMAIFLALFLVRGVASLFRRPKVEFALYVLVAGLVFANIVRLLVLRQISFEGPGALGYSLAFGICFAAAFAGWAVRMYPADTPVDSGLTLLLTPLRWSHLLPGMTGLIPLGLIA